MSRIRAQLQGIRSAVSYFTRVPVKGPVDESGLRGALRYFPLVGAGVGAVGAGAWALARLALPGDLAVLIGMAATVLITGALHEDGFADVCDGFGGGFDKEQVLAIMKDSRVGAFGAVGLILLLATKALALIHLADPLMLAALVCAHASSRWTAATLVAALPYARQGEDSKAKTFVSAMGPVDFAVSTTLGLAPTLLLLPMRCWFALAAPVLARLAMGSWFMRRIGGYTGDCIGATQQAGEVAFYLVLTGLTCR